MICSIGVIGVGAVGRAVVTALTATDLADELVVVSRTRASAEAVAIEANDMAAAARTTVRADAATSIADLGGGCHVVVIAVRARFTNTVAGPEQRLGGLHVNAPLVVELGRTLAGYRGVVLMVTNPVDVMVRLFAEASGTDACYGIGSNLDSARFRLVLAERYGVGVNEVAGQVVGEHGSTMTVLASTTSVRGEPVRVDSLQVRDAVLDRSPRINAALGRTAIGPAGAVLSTLRRVLGYEDGIEALSVRGSRGVFYGQLVEFRQAHPRFAVVPMSTSELAALASSVDPLDQLYRSAQNGLGMALDQGG